MSEQPGINLILALKEYALPQAEELEAGAAELRGKAEAMESRAKLLRAIHAQAAPYFPKSDVRLLKEAKG